ncbi:MAG: enoyl-CoA hydratase/carnithine racemase [Oleiphilaceae bacterium]|jgi:enoyl-CoA hydratase/carnithine racemase
MSQDLVQESLVISVLQASTGKIGMFKLNAEKTLNSLTLSMVEAMSAQLSDWEEDENIAAIILIGSGDKAFCAGGDVQALYQSAIETPGGPCVQGEAFFKSEYHLNYQLHTYSKPIICFGNGIVMGGGLGLMAGASHRIATESTRIAMPEITIGLFPDVGGTYFLNQMPYNFGVFFALTGASINARDALYTRLADHVIAWETHTVLLKNLQKVDWETSDIQRNHHIIDEQIETLALDTKTLHAMMESEIQIHHKLLETICLKTSLAEVILEISKFDEDNQWFNKAKSAITKGSPLSSVLIYEQLRRHRYSNLETVFLSEFLLATNIIRYPEFAEGVRALLIDKDKSPKWKFKHFSDIPCHVLEHFFTAPWDSNPLKLDLKG